MLEIIKNADRRNKVPQTAQDTIPFIQMFKDGTCKVTEEYFSKTIEYMDVNYQLAQDDEKDAIFKLFKGLLNFFDSALNFQFSYIDIRGDEEEEKKQINIPMRGDGFDSVRESYTEVIRSQMTAGSNGIRRRKFLTFGLTAESIREARQRLASVEADIIQHFKRMGAVAKALNGRERLEVMHSMLHVGENQTFSFDWKWLAASGLSVKDFIAPSSFTFKKSREFQIGETFAAMSFVQISAPEISDEFVKHLLETDSDLVLTMHVRSMDTSAAIKEIKHKITELDRSKIEEQKKAVRSGYDMDIIPSDLATYGADAKELLRDLQSNNERMFLVTLLIMNTGRTEKELRMNIEHTVSLIKSKNCNLVRLDYQQEDGLVSSLPLALNRIEIERSLTTSSLAIFMPFTTQELFQTGPGALYYGVNAVSHTLIMADRKRLKNPNGLILGQTRDCQCIPIHRR